MKRVKLVVAYDGTNYRGWQVQNNGETIESMLNRAISSLTCNGFQPDRFRCACHGKCGSV